MRKAAPAFYKDCSLCKVGFVQAVKDIETQEGETRSSAIRQLQDQMTEFAGLTEHTIVALRRMTDRTLGPKVPKREKEPPQVPETPTENENVGYKNVPNQQEIDIAKEGSVNDL